MALNKTTVLNAADTILTNVDSIEAELDSLGADSAAASAKCVGPRTSLQRVRNEVKGLQDDVRKGQFD